MESTGIGRQVCWEGGLESENETSPAVIILGHPLATEPPLGSRGDEVVHGELDALPVDADLLDFESSQRLCEGNYLVQPPIGARRR
jgi:hypothetical protein